MNKSLFVFFIFLYSIGATPLLPGEQLVETVPGITIEQLDSISQTEQFYRESLVLLDTLGSNGGEFGGGFLDTWYDQQQEQPLWQIQVALPQIIDSSNPAEPDTFTVWNEYKRFMPDSMDSRDEVFGTGPLFMMGAALAQEFTNIDMQLLLGLGFQESNAGLASYKVEWIVDSNEPYSGHNQLVYNKVNYTNHKSSSQETKGPIHYHERSFKEYVFETFPHYFPYDSVYVNSDKYITSSITGGCEMNSPQIANAYLITSLFMWKMWNIMEESYSGTLSEFFAGAENRNIAAQLMAWGWNKGGGVLNTFFQYPDGGMQIDTAISYVGMVWNSISYLETANRRSVLNGGTNAIYDTQISLADFEKLLFGTGGNPTEGVLGTAGILHHFELSENERIALWNDVTEAFDLLKGRAPSTIGTETVSYRYDYLALLRVAKWHLPISEKPDHTSKKIVSSAMPRNFVVSVQNDRVLLKASEAVTKVELYTVTGKRVRVLAGSDITEIATGSLSKGVYVLRVSLNESGIQKRMVLIK